MYICRTHWRVSDSDLLSAAQQAKQQHMVCALEPKKRRRRSKKTLDLTSLPTSPVVAQLEDAASKWAWKSDNADDDRDADLLLDEAISLFMTSGITDNDADDCYTGSGTATACEVPS
jgi:hypothetical protein